MAGELTPTNQNKNEFAKKLQTQRFHECIDSLSQNVEGAKYTFFVVVSLLFIILDTYFVTVKLMINILATLYFFGSMYVFWCVLNKFERKNEFQQPVLKVGKNK